MTQDIQPVIRVPLGPRIAPVQGQKSAARGAESALPANAAGHDVATFDRAQRLARTQDAKEAVLARLGDLRAADRAVAEVGQRLREANQELAAIVKRYPPYPPDSPEREQHLAKYSALRQLIDQLSYPKPESTEVAQASSGPGGVSLPPLSSDSSDADIEGAHARLETVRQQIADTRDRFESLSREAIESGATGRAESEATSIGLSLAARRFFALGAQGIAQQFEPALFGR